MIEPQRKETAHELTERVVDELLAKWRARGHAFTLLHPSGAMLSMRPGQLRESLTFVQQNPGTQLLELADPRSREFFLAWAIVPKGGRAN